MSPRTRFARPATRGPRTRRSRQRDEDEEVSEVYREMLAEAEARETGTSDNDRPSKRLKPSEFRARATSARARVAGPGTQGSVETGGNAAKIPQIVYNSPSESSEESDMEWEEVDIQQPTLPLGPISGADDAPLQITLGQQEDRRRRLVRRKPVTAAEKKLRLDVHKIHLLCLLCHVQRRNLWCNDEEVQGFVKKMLSKHITSQLNPPENKPQHARSAMFLDGLNQAGDVFQRRFKVTKPGLRRAHWAHDSESLRQRTEAIMAEAEVFLSKEDFLEQAKTMQGSRDFGAQLFCALLRSVAVEARLVCSLQPLPFSGTTRDMTPAKPEREIIVLSSDDPSALTDERTKSDDSPRPSPIRRLGRPSFKPPRVQSASAARPPPAIRESSYPVFWVEAFNEAFQKWVVIDPMVTKTLAKPHKLEPPTVDPYNLLSYVIAFEEDASARDVTRRYAKAFNAKTRKNRVESTKNGEAWWARKLQYFEKPFLEDRDELEIGELTAKTAAEPMPRNVQDFKDHPIYALERHLRRNEVIYPKRVIGHVSLGKSGAKGQASEPIYRRSDVHTLRSANKWYRLGRDIKIGEQSLKRIPVSKNKVAVFGDDEEADSAEETPLYAYHQTEPYKPPPVVQGRVPKNAYGNLDMYVPSMVPPGGVHINHLDAAYAARILAIDYADAVTGFNFKGRHGTAVFQGAVIASEYREALEEVLYCLEEEKLQNEMELKSAEVLRLWKHFLLKLRIAERVKSYAVEGEEADDEGSVRLEKSEDPEEMGGGFLPGTGEEMASPPVRSTADNTGTLGHHAGDKHPPLASVRDLAGGGFVLEGEPERPNIKAQSHSPRSSRAKYSLVVVPSNVLHAPEHKGQPPKLQTSTQDPVYDNSNALGASAEAPIMVESSLNDSASASVELLSRPPSQTQSRAQSVKSLSEHSEINEGSLLSEDPEDEDAVPEWLMSD